MTVKSEVLEKQKKKVIFERGKRCSDYDADCIDVSDHFVCWMGTAPILVRGVIWETWPSDGYCPYVIGMIDK